MAPPRWAVRQSRPDLVVIDIMMPVSDGTEFIQQLRDEPATAAIPVLASSAGCHFACSPDIVAFKPYGEHVLAIAHALLAVRNGSSAATTAENGSAGSLRVVPLWNAAGESRAAAWSYQA